MGLQGPNGRGRDIRRRRLIGEPSSDEASRFVAAPVSAPTDSEEEMTSEPFAAIAPYATVTVLRSAPRITDLFPRRRRDIALGFLFAAAAIIALEAACYFAWRSPKIAPTEIAPFAVWGQGTLFQWLGAMTMGIAALASWGVYSIRKHRQDDYRATYRIWAWAAVAAIGVSMDIATGLRETFESVMILATGTPLLGEGDAWWIVAYACLMVGVGGRMLADMRYCKTALAAGTGAACAYMLLVGLRSVDCGPLTSSAINSAEWRSILAWHMLLAAVGLIAHFALLASMLFYGQFVLLEAQGRVQTPSFIEQRRQKAARRAQRVEHRQTEAEKRQRQKAKKAERLAQLKEKKRQEAARKQEELAAQRKESNAKQTASPQKSEEADDSADKQAIAKQESPQKAGPLGSRVSKKRAAASTPQASEKQPAKQSADKGDDTADEPSEEAETISLAERLKDPTLTKAQRKALKRQMRKQQRRAA